MQLTTDQIKLGVLHPDREVREAALLSFRQSLSTDPAVMPLLIQAIDRYGWNDACFPFYDSLPLAQTADTVAWLIRWLNEPEPQTDNVSLWKCWQRFLSRQLTAATPELLAGQEDVLGGTSALLPEHFEDIQERIRLAALDRDEFLRELNESCQENANAEMPIDLADHEQARYAEALVRVDPDCAERILDLLSEPFTLLQDSDAQHWMEAIATRAAGRLRLVAAIPRLRERLEIDAESDGDWYCDVCADALIQIGSDEVIQTVGHQFKNMGESVRIVVTRLFEGIRSERAARIALQLVSQEPEDHVREALVDGLLAQFDADALAKVREYILRGEVAEDIEGYLIRRYVAASTLMQLPLGDLEPWRARAAFVSERLQSHLIDDLTHDGRFRSDPDVELDEIEREFPLDEIGDYDEWGMFDDEDEDFDDELDPEEEDEGFGGELNDEEDEGPDRPIVHFELKVGRNDPCPCGSGKKFKKCCMNKPKPPTVDW